jgi:hypothetical protein
VHYYLYEYTDEEGNPAALCVEFHSDSVEFPPGDEFEEITVEELHQKGYLTSDEQLANTPPENVNSVEFSTGRRATSWVNIWYVYHPDFTEIWHYCGSRTKTIFQEYIKVRGVLYKKDPVSGRVLRTFGPAAVADMNGPEVDVWWKGKHNYPPVNLYVWHQHG